MGGDRNGFHTGRRGRKEGRTKREGLSLSFVLTGKILKKYHLFSNTETV